MAFSGYNIDAPAARGVVSAARGRFDDLDGMENTIEVAGEAVADAAVEADINTALKSAFSDFLRPFVVTMISTADNIFTTTDSVINTYDNADTQMSDEVKTQAVQDMVYDAKAYDNVPDYSASDSTAGDGQGADANTEGYDW